MNNKQVVALLCANSGRAAEIAKRIQESAVAEPVVCATSDDFCHTVQHQRIDAVIVEQELTGFLSGLEIIERLAGDLLQPAVILLAKDVAALRGKAARVNVKTLLDTQTDSGTIVDVLKGELLTADEPGVSIPHSVRVLVRDADYVPPIPQLLVRLPGYLHNESASMAELTEELSTDPRITAELLKVVNSSSTGVRSKVTRVFDAVNLLGIRRTVAIVLSTTVLNSQQKLMQTLPEGFEQWFRPRTVLIAASASAFAARTKQVSADTAHILGLLQDLGVLVMARALGKPYQRVLERCRTVGQLQLHIAEQQEFAFTHAAVSAALFQRWELPGSFVRLALEHHTPAEECECSTAEQHLLQLMKVGEAVADLYDLPGPQRHQRLQSQMTALSGGKPELFKSCLASAVQKTREFSSMFSVPAPSAAALESLTADISRFAAGEPVSEGERVPAVETGASPTEGSSFSVNGHLSATSAAKMMDVILPPSEPLTDRKLSVTAKRAPALLVIEDEESIVSVIRLMLLPLGVQVLQATTGLEAVELAREADAILCEVHLKCGSGIDVIRDVRNAQISIPVIMNSEDRSRETILSCLEVGIADYLLKPVTRNALLDRLRKHTSISLGQQDAVLRMVQGYVQNSER
ncbi:MAG: HDOD domain-containing protein [Planctomycetaceae bacterium]|nr:HDOD domain-containing protein [Planctomycetaceae bacterium]